MLEEVKDQLASKLEGEAKEHFLGLVEYWEAEDKKNVSNRAKKARHRDPMTFLDAFTAFGVYIEALQDQKKG